ncbi:MAG: hypothetical protein RIA62_01725, partial [Cyclobacteriaceae bacterium]
MRNSTTISQIITTETDQAFWALTIFLLVVFLAYFMMKLKVWRVITTGQLKSHRAHIEDILKQLYHVEAGGKSVGIIDLSGVLRISDKKMLNLIEEMV